MKSEEKKKDSYLFQIFDTLFILILCFGTLFTAMMLQKGDVEGLKYVINFKTLIITFVVLLLYLTYIIPISNKQLGRLVDLVYSEKDCSTSAEVEEEK